MKKYERNIELHEKGRNARDWKSVIERSRFLTKDFMGSEIG